MSLQRMERKSYIWRVNRTHYLNTLTKTAAAGIA